VNGHETNLFLHFYVCMCRSLLFSRKGYTDQTNTNRMPDIPGWKLFGKIPPKQAPEKDLSLESVDYRHTRVLDVGKPGLEFASKPISNLSSVRGTVARRSEKEVPSTTALILEHRPELVSCCYDLSKRCGGQRSMVC